MKIAVSGLNATDNPAPGIGVAKSLIDEYDVIGLSYDANEPGNYLEITKKNYLMPYPSLGYEELKNRLLEIKKKEDIKALIPNLDAELMLYVKYQKEIEDLGIKLFIPREKNFELRNKSSLSSLAPKIGLKYPETFVVNTISEMQKVAQKIGYPFMVKGNYYKAYKVYNFDSACDAFYKISNEWGFPILIQKTVSGVEVNLVGVGDGEGELKGVIVIKKLTTTTLGKVWTAITIENENLLKTAKKFVEMTGWRGPFELECMAEGENINVIEINPRFPAWIYFATGVGVNLPKMVVKLMTGEKVNSNLDYPTGKLYVRFTDETIVDFDKFKKLVTNKEL